MDFQFNRAGMLCRQRSIDAVVALPQGHPLAEKIVLTRSDLIGEKIIEVHLGSTYSKRLSLILEGIERTSMIETNQSLTACSIALEGGAIAVIDHFAASEFLARGLVIRRFEPSLEASFTELSAAESRRGDLTTEFADGFWAFLQEELMLSKE